MSAITSPVLTGSLSTAAQFSVVDFERVGIQVVNDNVAALSAFQVQGRADTAGPFHVLLTAYTTMGGILIAAGKGADGSASDLVTLGQNLGAWLVLQTKGLAEIRLQATGAGATLTFYICGK